MLLPLIGCPRPSGIGNKDEQQSEYQSDWVLSEEEKAAVREREEMEERMHKPGDDNVVYRSPDMEIEKLKKLIEGIRQDCQYSVNKYVEMLEKRSYSSNHEFFYMGEERARILGKHDVCSQILARIEKRQE